MAESSRQRIQRALFSLLEEWPIESITVSEVTSRAGVSRTTYYRLYDSLESVINDALDELFSRVEPLVPRKDEKGNYDERLIELSVYQMLYCYKSEVELLCPLMHGSGGVILYHRLFDFVHNLIKKYGSWPEQDTVNAMEQIYVTAGMTAVIYQWVANNCEEPIEDMLKMIMRARMTSPFTQQ